MHQQASSVTSHRLRLKNCAACSSVNVPPRERVSLVLTRPGIGGLEKMRIAYFFFTYSLSFFLIRQGMPL